VHGSELNKGSIWMYYMPREDEEGKNRAVFRLFTPREVRGLPYDYDVFAGIGTRALIWTTLSACEVAHQLTWKDLDKDCQSLREDKYLGLDLQADPPEIRERDWLGGVFESQVILGWDGMVDTGFAQQFWQAFFEEMGTKKKSIGGTLDAGHWGEGEKGATSWLLILRVLRHPDYDKDENDESKWYWPTTYPRTWPWLQSKEEQQ
jgi:hypothetical protein